MKAGDITHKWSVPAFRPIGDRLTVWTGAVAALSIGTPGSLARYGASTQGGSQLQGSTGPQAQYPEDTLFMIKVHYRHDDG